MSSRQIPIIDLFAGPGGLGEGFTSVVDNNNNRAFKIALSIEKDKFAHQTLTLRSFVRQFPLNKLPEEYYQFVRGEIREIETLYNLYPKESASAKNEAWQFILGDPQTHDEIDKRIKRSLKGENNFVLIGGPPCQAYSLVGRARRREGKGLNKEDERVYLYREYYRILAQHRPSVFIMENVKGLLSSKVEDELIFNQLINDLKDPIEAYKKLRGQEKIYKSRIKYNIFSLVKSPEHNLFGGFQPKDFIIRTEDYGIPQTRHRVILLGVRSNTDIYPELLKIAPERIPIKKVLAGLPPLRSGLSKSKDGKEEWKQVLLDLKTSRIKNEVAIDVWSEMEEVIDKISVPRKDKGSSYIEYDAKIEYQPEWYLDKNLKGVCNHETRSHIKEDLWRYLFVSCFGKVKGQSPKLSDFPKTLLPKHENVSVGVSENKFADRFRVQLSNESAKTITSHISKDGHYYIHYDPSQCRSLTVREAARIQTFPDNYFFCGPRTQQFHQVGNAVPPLLSKQIAEIVKKLF